MANKYWVSAGNANWATAANWRTSSGGSTTTTVPTASDNVFFDANSGTATVTIAAAATCLDLKCTNWGGTMAGTSTLAISGSFFGGGSWTYSGAVTFNSTSSGNTIDCVGTSSNTGNGICLGRSNITFNGTGGVWGITTGLAANTAAITTRTLTLTAGTMNITSSSNYVQCGTFSSSGTGVRSITMPSPISIYVYGLSGTVVDMTTITNLTLSSTYVDFYVGNYANTTNTNTKTISLGAFSAANAPNIEVESHGGTVSITGNINTLNFLVGTIGTQTVTNNAITVYEQFFISSAGFTFTGGANALTFIGGVNGINQFDATGTTLDFPIVVDSGTGNTCNINTFTQGSTRTFTFSSGTIRVISSSGGPTFGSFVTSGTTMKYLTSYFGSGSPQTITQASGTVTATYLTISGSTATGGATWDATSPTNVNLGGNTGWLFAAPSSANFFMIF